MARVGTRGAGLSKDIALSVKNKLTHLGANVSDDLARLSGKVEDAFAYADGAVSKNIGKHNARVYQSNGGNWDEVASGILGSSGAGRKAAAEFSDDASQALAKHGDEVSQALKETREQAGKHASAEFGGEASINTNTGHFNETTEKILGDRAIDNSNWGSEALSDLRERWNVPETDTIAVGKTDIPGLEDRVFEGGSPKVRKEAGLPDLDEAFPDREIQSPRKNALFTRHAEENVIQEFISGIEELGIPDDEVIGTFKLHQSNSSGVCGACKQGLTNPDVKSGILKQFSMKYPNLTIEITTESAEIGSKLNFRIQNGNLL